MMYFRSILFYLNKCIYFLIIKRKNDLIMNEIRSARNVFLFLIIIAQSEYVSCIRERSSDENAYFN